MRISYRLRWSASAAAAGMWLTLLPVMANGQEVLEYPSQASFPNENREAVTRHLANANSIAGADLWSEFRWRCMISPLDRDMVWGVQHDGLVPATRLFDNLYSVGQNSVSSFALDTDEGIILIDALNSTDEAREIIIPNLRALGLDPARIRYVIVTHGHGDHYGGAKYLQETYGARVVSSATDWQMMEDAVGRPGPFGSLVPPTRDIVAEDGDTISLGATTVRLAITPGHTPGTLSLIFPVYEDGQQHMAGLMGGSGGGRDSETHHQQIASLHRWNELTAAAGVDVLLPASYREALYEPLIREAEVRYRLPPGLMQALVWAESRFNPMAISPAGAAGLAQLMPATARELGVRNRHDPRQNIDGGARYLRKMLDRFGEVHLALAAYNAGPGAVTRAGGIPRNRETPAYVRSVLRRWMAYRPS